ncbi:unnamed protein product [Prorocentrum cordatum]|uniref:Pseudouridine synthase RsuA/RluA-like domain-containing protein n=1 Tax=Prorocentrum cordatum TaxID=2364126 RepID=A0ABN9WJ38_9DINO|nr:unnamed protein product [Polarella glacialis]
MGPRELPAGGGAVAGGAASDAACSDPGRAPGGDANAGGAAGGGQLLEGVTPRRLRQLQLTALLEKQKALCVVCKPPDVRVDVPRRRPDYYAADEPLRHFPEEVTVEDWFLGRYRGEKFRLVNQLDFATSGILVLGRTKEGAAWASAALRTKEDATASSSDKVYDCIVCGSVVPAEGTISAPIRDRCKGSFERVVDEADDCDAGADRATLNWQFAETEFTVRKRGVYAGGVPASLLRVQLRTGRRHQIRVHLAHIGHPVLGDDTYCRSEGRVGQGNKDPVALRYESESGFESLLQEVRMAESASTLAWLGDSKSALLSATPRNGTRVHLRLSFVLNRRCASSVSSWQRVW